MLPITFKAFYRIRLLGTFEMSVPYNAKNNTAWVRSLWQNDLDFAVLALWLWIVELTASGRWKVKLNPIFLEKHFYVKASFIQYIVYEIISPLKLYLSYLSVIIITAALTLWCCIPVCHWPLLWLQSQCPGAPLGWSLWCPRHGSPFQASWTTALGPGDTDGRNMMIKT